MSQATRILLALALGLVLGIAAASMDASFALGAANLADPIGNLWLNGLRMTIVPLLVALLVTGIAQTAEAAKAGKIAARALVWIISIMTLSAIAGAILTPGSFTRPETEKERSPVRPFRPWLVHQEGPRSRMSRTQNRVSTLLTSVGRPNSPTWAT